MTIQKLLTYFSSYYRESDSGYAEKFKFKWAVPIKDVEVIDSDVTSLYQVKSRPGTTTIIAPKPGKYDNK